MFFFGLKKHFPIRQKFFYEYQEQRDTLDVTFECRNGKQKCSQHVLHIMSDFYSDQLDAIERFKNQAVFRVDFSIECVKAYLDALHGIREENGSLVTTMELIKFLKDLARDKSQFEGELLVTLCSQLREAELDLQTKLLICLVSNTFDNFDGYMEQYLFRRYDSTEVLLKMADLNLKDEQSKKLIKLISDEDIDSIEEEIEFKVFRLAKSLKQKNITKTSLSSQTEPISAVPKIPANGSPGTPPPLPFVAAAVTLQAMESIYKVYTK